ncbi:MAG TPA: hypothetical protein VK168_02155 [Saprospiraceae bacterium]|nr:hypothetical protein [Saprospiraceae bacterium]
MVSKILKTIFLYSLIIWAATAQAQPVQISVALAPPYPIHLEDYAQMKGQVIITMVNTGQTPLQLRLVPSVQGQNGISATLKPGYRPPSPLLLGPLETRVLTGGQLQALNMGISLENMDIKGVNVQQIIRTETLPEGLYDLCVRAFDFNSNTQLSKDGSGCAPFNITWYDPPVVMQPADKATVPVLQPQFVNIGWTPSGIGGVTRYKLLLMDMTANGLANPNDAFNMGFPPFFQKDNLLTLGHPLGLAEPPLTPGHKYAVRVQAYDPQGNLKYKNEGRSQVTTFVYGSTNLPGGPSGGGGIDIPFDDLANPKQDPVFNTPDPNDPLDCMAAFEVAMPSSATQYTPKTGDTVVIGKFRMKILNIAGGSGEGEIYIAFLKTKVKVTFENLQVNGQKQAYGNSKAWVKIDQANLVEQAMANDPTGNLSNVKVKDINDFVQNANRKVSKFIGEQSQPIGVPFALDNAKNQNLILLGIIFTATKAQANMVYGMPVPEALNNDWFQLGAKGIGIRPNGFGLDGGKISLASDKTFALTDHTSFILFGGANKTYLEFDCKGISKVQLNGGMEFSRDKAIPVDAQNKVVAAPAKLVAKFEVAIENAMNWTADATLSHPKFSVPHAEGILFSAQNLKIDQSSTANVPGMKFPSNHPKKNKVDWRGIYLGTVSITMPDWMKDGKKNAPVAVVGLSDLLLDKTGLWTNVQALNVMPKLDDGDLAGWAFSVDTIRLKIESSALTGGGVGGYLRLPVCESGVKYAATIAAGNPEADFSFSVKTTDEVEIDAFIAKAVFGPNSSITIAKKDGKWSPAADVNGSITVGWEEANKDAQKENAVSSFKLPTLQFSKLLIQNNAQGKPRVQEFKIEWDNPNVKQNDQHKLAGFPLKLGGLSVDCDGDVLALGLDLDITLTKGEANKNGLKGSTAFSINGQYDNDKKCYLYKNTTIDSISVNAKLSVAEIGGALALYKKDDTFGNGFKGSITATIRGIGIGVTATLQVGNVTEKGQNFDYFFFDGLFKYDQGFKIPGAPMASIYGFGGGVWYNMEPTSPLKDFNYAAYGENPGDLNKPGSTATGVVFEPQLGKLGFKAKVLFGLSGGAQAGGKTFNGDVTFTMYLSTEDKFRLDSIVLDGNAYVVQPMDSRNNARIHGFMHMQMDFVSPSFTLVAGLQVDLGSVLSGDATLAMHFSKQEWYVHLGKWSTKELEGMDPWSNSPENTRCNLNIDLKVLEASVGCYFMIGSDVPGLPPLPKSIRDKMVDQNNKPVSDNRPDFGSFDGAKPGFGFGAALKAEIDISVLIVYADIDITIGFDAVLQDLKGATTCDGNTVGVNGWYAQGQAYALLDAEVGLRLDLWFWKSPSWKLFDMYAVAVLEGSFPNPNYFKGFIAVNGQALNGLIKVNRSFQFETGEKPCYNPSPFGQYPIVAAISPKENDKVAAHKNVQIAFNFPRGYFEVANTEQPEIPAKFYCYKIEKFEVKHGNQSLPMSAIDYVDEYHAQYYPKTQYGLWPEKAHLRLFIEVNGYEKGKATPVTKKPERDTVEFDTREWPKKVDWAMLQESNPQPNKRFFNHNGKKGFLKYKPNKGQGYIFNPQNDDKALYDVSKTKYYTVFTELKTGKRSIGTFTYNNDGSLIEFPIPADLKKTTIYSFELIKELTTLPKPAEDQYDPNNPDTGGGWGQGDSNGNSEGGQYTDAEWKELYGGGVYRINRLLLPDTTTKKVRVALCRIYFKTSKYHTLAEKVATYQVKGVGYLKQITHQRFIKATPKGQGFSYSVEENKAVTTELPILFMAGGEQFDEYDAYGYTLDPGNYEIKVEPHVTFETGSDQKVPFEYYERYLLGQNPSDIEIRKIFEGRDWFGTGWPYISDVHTPTHQQLANVNWSGYIEFWRNSEHGSINAYKPAGLKVLLPAKPLSQAEIDAAIAQGPQQGNGNIGNIVLNVQQPGNGMNMPGMGLAAGADSDFCVPIVDESLFVINRDYWIFMRDGWGYFKTHYDEPSKQLWLQNTYDYMQDYLKPRPEAKQSILMNGSSKPYTWKK